MSAIGAEAVRGRAEARLRLIGEGRLRPADLTLTDCAALAAILEDFTRVCVILAAQSVESAAVRARLAESEQHRRDLQVKLHTARTGGGS